MQRHVKELRSGECSVILPLPPFGFPACRVILQPVTDCRGNYAEAAYCFLSSLSCSPPMSFAPPLHFPLRPHSRQVSRCRLSPLPCAVHSHHLVRSLAQHLAAINRHYEGVLIETIAGSLFAGRLI